MDFGGTLGRKKFYTRDVPPIPVPPVIGLAGGSGSALQLLSHLVYLTVSVISLLGAIFFSKISGHSIRAIPSAQYYYYISLGL